MLSWLLYPIFLEVQGRGKRQSQLQIWLQPFSYFLLSLSNHAYSGNKRHISSLERLITGLWSPDIILHGQGKQRRELVEVIQSIPLSSPRELSGIFTILYSAPVCLWVLPHRLLFFVHVFHLQLLFKSSMTDSLQKSLCVTWCVFFFKDTYFN